MLFFSCKEKKSPEIAAELNNIPIYSSELNTLIKQELYDELYRIYEIKESALNQLIGYKLIENEARRHNLSTAEYVNNYIEIHLNDTFFKNKNESGNITVYRNNNIYAFDKNSIEGKSAKYNNYKSVLLKQLVDSLKNGTSIKKYIYPPVSPELKFNELLIHYKGNASSKTQVILISDFDCHNCIEQHPIYREIFNTYKDKIKFGFIHFSAYPTLPQIASEAAGNQEKFWEYQECIFNHKTMIDSTIIYGFADSLNLDMDRFKRDLDCKDIRQKLELSNENLVKGGIYATPTLLINNKLIVNSGSYEEICFLIEKAISGL